MNDPRAGLGTPSKKKKEGREGKCIGISFCIFHSTSTGLAQRVEDVKVHHAKTCRDKTICVSNYGFMVIPLVCVYIYIYIYTYL